MNGLGRRKPSGASDRDHGARRRTLERPPAQAMLNGYDGSSMQAYQVSPHEKAAGDGVLNFSRMGRIPGLASPLILRIQ